MKKGRKGGANKWLTLTSMPIQMGAVIYIFHLFGGWITKKMNLESEIWSQLITLLGIIVALIQVVNQVNQLNKRDDK